MIMDTLKSLQVFSTVASTKSFIVAANQIGISAAMASKHVQNIESKVGARLLNRTSRKVSLTEAGENYLVHVKSLLEGLEEAEEFIKESTVEPKGMLKVSLPVWMSNPPFATLIAQYKSQYPEVSLNLDFSGKEVDMVEESYDLAIRAGEVKTEGLIARKIASIKFSIVASPSFLERHDKVEHINDLENMPFFAYSRVVAGNRLKKREEISAWDIQINPDIQSENEVFLLLLVLEGTGVSILPNWLIDEHLQRGELTAILPDVFNPEIPLRVLSPHRKYLPAKTRSFINFLIESVFNTTSN